MRYVIMCLIWVMLGTLPANAADKMKVVTSFTIIADMAQNVAGDAAIVKSITKPGAEIHDYQPTPKDLIKAQDADLILWNGLNLERWFKRFLLDVQDVPNIVVSQGIQPVSIYEGPYEGKPNPHAWMSVENALVYVENIRKAFVQADPENADVYNANAARYAAQLSAIKTDLMARMNKIPAQQRYLVTSEGAFSYLAKDFNLTEVYL